MPKGYIYAELEVTDPAGFEAYRAKVGPNVAAFGGRFLIRGADPQVLEGDRAVRRAVLLEFDSPEQAMTWYKSPEYQELAAMRQAASDASLVLLSGV